ncbi:NAD(P)-binding protein [Mycena sanguinolenta]|uniref:NAD(P)-binding protein n=1 Tax=Mycena sanguinolenta TaxID=230812 RepID=A0A8H7DBM5_9AGAR|nr:NAD(P)-binding protein [Mycena sanguinolenta]
MTSRVWFITGASSGFGLFVAEKALENGERVVVATLRKPEVISDLATKYDELEMKTQKKQLLVLRPDVTIKEEISAAFIAAKQTFGRIDVVFNNAGIGLVSEVEGVTDVNARNLFKQALKYFRKNDPAGGLLINMSSMFGVDASPGVGLYAAAKFALDALTDSLVKELDPAWNINIMIFLHRPFQDQHGYGKEHLASIQVREAVVGLIRGDSPLYKDARKLIDRFWDLSKLEKPPYRVAFGEDAKAAFKARWATLKSDLEASEDGRKPSL